ncbi:MAG: glycosyltransferase, partial [Candidatus Dormibacteria bacterium]
MRILLSTIGSRGDAQPLVALAVALREAGHQARLCVPPDFRECIEGLGFRVSTVGPELRALTAGRAAAPPLPGTPEQRRQLAEGTVAAQFEVLSEAAQDVDLVVAATALQIAARTVTEVHRIPYVFAAYAPTVLPSPHHAPPPIPGRAPIASDATNQKLWDRDRDSFNDLFGEPLNAQRRQLGLAPVDDVRAHVFGDVPLVAADPTLGPWPGPPGAVVQKGAWLLRDERPLGPHVEAFLDAGEMPLYFGLGSMRAPSGVGAAMVMAARALGRRALVNRGWGDIEIEDADDMIAIDEVNHQALFPRVAAVVHHGGAGTTTAAAMSGTPQVVVPRSYDQPYWASRVQALDIGVAHSPGTPSAESLTLALKRALQPAVAQRAATVARAIVLDGARAAAAQLASG